MVSYVTNYFKNSNLKRKAVQFSIVTDVFDGVVENTFNFTIDVSYNRLSIYFRGF